MGAQVIQPKSSSCIVPEHFLLLIGGNSLLTAVFVFFHRIGIPYRILEHSISAVIFIICLVNGKPILAPIKIPIGLWGFKIFVVSLQNVRTPEKKLKKKKKRAKKNIFPLSVGRNQTCMNSASGGRFLFTGIWPHQIPSTALLFFSFFPLFIFFS